MARLRANIISNYAGKGWGVLSVFLFVPVYLRFLGIEAYGIVGFYAVLLSVLAFADMGLTATLSREMARLSGTKDCEWQMRNLVRTIEMLYLGISVFLALVVLVLAGPIARHWLNFNSLPISSVEHAICLMGFSIAMGLPARLYSGGLLGLQKQILVNSIHVFTGMFRGGGAVLILWLVSPTIEAFFLWQILSSGILLSFFRHFLWANLPGKSLKVKFQLSSLKGVMRYSIGMAIISFNSLILMQVDKIILSKMLSLETLAYYSLASTLAQAPLLLSAPVSVAVFPRLTQLMAAGKEMELARIYHHSNQLVASIVFPIGLILAAFSRELILFWTQSVQTANETCLIASLLVAGSMFLAIQVIPFRLALAAAWTRLLIYLGCCSIIIIVPLFIFLIQRYGMAGAGISWIALNSISLPVFIFLLHRRLLRGHATRWFLHDMARPFIISLVFIISVRLYVTPEMNMVVALMLIALTVALSCSVCLAATLGFHGLGLKKRPTL